MAEGRTPFCTGVEQGRRIKTDRKCYTWKHKEGHKVNTLDSMMKSMASEQESIHTSQITASGQLQSPSCLTIIVKRGTLNP